MHGTEGTFEFQEFETGAQHADTEPLRDMSPDGHRLIEVNHVLPCHTAMQLRRSLARPIFDVILALVPIFFFGKWRKKEKSTYL